MRTAIARRCWRDSECGPVEPRPLPAPLNRRRRDAGKGIRGRSPHLLRELTPAERALARDWDACACGSLDVSRDDVLTRAVALTPESRARLERLVMARVEGLRVCVNGWRPRARDNVCARP